jgi:hypothetical protein
MQKRNKRYAPKSMRKKESWAHEGTRKILKKKRERKKEKDTPYPRKKEKKMERDGPCKGVHTTSTKTIHTHAHLDQDL